MLLISVVSCPPLLKTYLLYHLSVVTRPTDAWRNPLLLALTSVASEFVAVLGTVVSWSGSVGSLLRDEPK
jgi:hypothetical protein